MKRVFYGRNARVEPPRRYLGLVLCVACPAGGLGANRSPINKTL